MSWLWLILLLVAAVVIRVLTLKAGPSGDALPGASYSRKPYFFTRSENGFYGLLGRLLEGRNVAIFPKVRVADVLEVSAGGRSAFNRIAQKHVDYLIVSLPNCQPILAIELDGRSHGSERQQARDAVKNAAFRSAGLPLVRVPVSRDPSDVMVLSMIEPHLKPALEPAQKRRNH